MGALAGNGVRFGPHAEVMAVGEGIETMLSLRIAMPTLSMIAALSAAHLAAFVPPVRLRRLYIAADSDAVDVDRADIINQGHGHVRPDACRVQAHRCAARRLPRWW